MFTGQLENIADPRLGEARPGITANLRQLTPKSPILGFTIRPAGAAFYEVLLGGTPDAVRQGSGSPDVFYSSAEHSGLIPASEPLYTVPAPALERLKRHERLYYSVNGFSDSRRNGRIQAVDTSTPDERIQYVSLSSGFRGSAMASILCIPLERLQRVRRPDAEPEPAYSTETLSAEEDLAEGEDGYGLAAPASFDQFADARPMEDDYEDGFGAAESLEPRSQCPTQAQSAESITAQREEPATLEDEDERNAESVATQSQGSEDAEYSDGFEPSSEGHPPAAAESFQAEDEAPYQEEAMSEEQGAATIDEPRATPLDRPPLRVEDKLRLIQAIAPFESGHDSYAAINADGEFAGRFPHHPATGRYHIGLSYGIVQFTQDSGSLGRLLERMRSRDAARFREVFGPHADDLVNLTNRPGPPSRESADGRSARVQPLDGSDLWQEPWLARFRHAAAPDLFGSGRQLFNGAQNELAAEQYLNPMLRFCAWLGFNTDRALAMVLDRAVQMGIGGAQRWIMDAIGVAATPALRQQALAALGHASVEAFQRATPGLRNDGHFGPQTHAALVAALRQLGERSPIPVPTTRQMLETLARRAASTRWARRTQQLFESTSFQDTEFDLSN